MNLSEVYQGEFCVNSSNSSCLRVSPTTVDVLLYASLVAVIFVTVFGNILVIISICHFKQLHTPTNFLLLSLAMADFLVGLISLPFQFRGLFPQWCFGQMYCNIGHVTSFHLTCVSIYNVAFIAVDRYFAVSNPFLYCTKMTVNITLRTLSIMWLCSFIYNVLLLYFNEAITDMKGNITCLDCLISTFNEMWTIIDFVVVFLLPCMTIIILYMKIFYVAKRHANKINCAKKDYSNGTKNNNTSMASESKAAKRLGILVVVFLVCMVPYYICAFHEVYIKTPATYRAVSSAAPAIYINSAINPIIYALFYPWFQKSVKLIVTLRICGSESSLMNVLVKET